MFVFLESRVSVRLSSNTVFRTTQLSPSAFFTVPFPHMHRVIGNTRAWEIFAMVSNDMSLLSVVFPNSSLLPL